MLREGVRYVRSQPKMMLILVMVFFAGTFGMNFQITSALMATEVFGKGAGEFGLLGSAMAVGSLAGALLAARRTEIRLRLRRRRGPRRSASPRSWPACCRRTSRSRCLARSSALAR